MGYANEAVFLNQMMSYGISAHVPLRVGTSLPFRFSPGKGKSKDAWYWLREFPLDNGSVVLTGAFGLWGAIDGSIKVDISSVLDDLSAAKRDATLAAMRERAAADEKKWVEERARAIVRASESARREWFEAGPLLKDASESAYARRKMIDLPSARIDADGRVIVPMIDYASRTLVGVQRISDDGSKRFTAGCAKAGAGVRLGGFDARAPLVLICEGYATGVTLYMAGDCKFVVYVAFDAGNLLALALKVRELHPSARIIFCADDDYKTHVNGKHVNVGRVKAKKAAWQVGGAIKKRAGVIFPVFNNRIKEKWTDFNDLHVVEGLDVVRRQLSILLQR